MELTLTGASLTSDGVGGVSSYSPTKKSDAPLSAAAAASLSSSSGGAQTATPSGARRRVAGGGSSSGLGGLGGGGGWEKEEEPGVPAPGKREEGRPLPSPAQLQAPPSQQQAGGLVAASSGGVEHHDHSHHSGHGPGCPHSRVHGHVHGVSVGGDDADDVAAIAALATSDPRAARMSLAAAVKVGTFERFRRIADAIRRRQSAKDGEGGPDGGGDNANCVDDESVLDLLGGHGEDGHTLSHWASKRVDDTRFLDYLSRVPNLDMNLPSRDSVGMRPLHWAATEGSIPIVAMLLRRLDSNDYGGGGGGGSGGEGRKSRGSRARALSHRSSSADLLETVPLDSSHGDESERGDDDNDDGAVEPPRRSSALPAIDSRDLSGCTPLLISSQYGHADLAAFLVKRGADVDAVDTSRDAALHWAAYKGSVPVCGLLLHLGGVRGKVDMADAYGQTPLHLASLRGNVEVVQYLMEEAGGYWDSTRRKRRERGGGSDHLRFVAVHRLRRSVGRASTASAGGGGPSDVGGATAAASSSSELSFPAQLLTLRDRDGKTPLDLAVKKKRTGCELVLRENEETYLRSPHTSPASRVLSSSVRTVRQLCSIKSWKAWMGLIPEAQSGAVSPAFPFYLVVVTMTMAGMFYPMAFLPVLRGKGTNPGILWDVMWLHATTLCCMAGMWTNFILTWRTDPGTLGAAGGGGGGDSNNSANGSTSVACSCGIDNVNGPVRRETGALSKRLRRQYDETLESYSEETTGNPKRPSHPPLCHSCHIAKPLRSKHCRVLRRCVLLYDHHCPFVGATIGLYNYRNFYLFLLFGSLSVLGFISTYVLYLVRCPTFPPLIALGGLYVSVFCLPFFGMAAYHTQLSLRNLTTNEHQNLWRFKYLQDEFGRYRNPFDLGRGKNLAMRLIHPGEDSYVLPPPPTMHPRPCCASPSCADENVASTDNGHAVIPTGKETTDEEEERKDLLRNVV